jgi:putative DNA primase/helicase
MPEPEGERNLPVTVETNMSTIIVNGTTYLAANDKLYTVTKKGDQSVETFVSSLIVVVATARDHASSNWGKVLRFEDQDGITKNLFVSSSDIATNGRAVVKSLVNEGLQVSTDNRMIDLLLNYLNLAPPIEPKRARCTDRTGWHGTAYLFHDNSTIGVTDGKVVYTGAPFGNHNATKGTVEAWRENVAALCKGNSLMILAVCIAFASVLLRLLKMESGGFHIFGESSTGKTTTLYVGASVHGDPEHVMGTWRTTANGAEGRAKKFNDALMIIDELHQSNPKEAGEAAYLLMNGKGKQRANVLGDAREVTEWKVNCLSSGEIAYEAFVQEGGKKTRAGQTVRMVDISADMGTGMGIFENIHGENDAHTFAEQVKKACFSNYGTPIRKFLEELTGNIDQLEKVYQEFKTLAIDDFVPAESGPQVKRVAEKFVIAALAGEIATNMGITGWEDGDACEAVSKTFTRWLNARGTTGQLEAENGVEQVKEFLLRHGLCRFAPIKKSPNGQFALEYSDRQVPNLAGFRLKNDEEKYEFIVLATTYRDEICQGLNSSFVTKILVKRGYLQLDESDGKPQARRRLPGMVQNRVYHFNASIFGDEDVFTPEEPEVFNLGYPEEKAEGHY